MIPEFKSEGKGLWDLRLDLRLFNELLYTEEQEKVETEKDGCIIPKHKTKRDINWRLRFKVFQRDHFRCRACGKSPAKDIDVELHVDHIIPWAKGGETVIENLQTLCSVCNIGKSDYTE